MDEWQPVRIAPFDGKAHCPTKVSPWSLERRKELAGKIFMAKEVPLGPYWICGASRNFLLKDTGAIWCEHQILAD